MFTCRPKQHATSYWLLGNITPLTKKIAIWGIHFTLCVVIKSTDALIPATQSLSPLACTRETGGFGQRPGHTCLYSNGWHQIAWWTVASKQNCFPPILFSAKNYF